MLQLAVNYCDPNGPQFLDGAMSQTTLMVMGLIALLVAIANILGARSKRQELVGLFLFSAGMIAYLIAQAQVMPSTFDCSRTAELAIRLEGMWIHNLIGNVMLILPIAMAGYSIYEYFKTLPDAPATAVSNFKRLMK